VAPGRLVHESFWSPALGQKRSYLVYTPPGYAAQAARGRRFPVLYLLHGSPGTPKQFINIARVGIGLDQGLANHTLRPFLIAMPSGSNGTFRSETEWADTPHGRYESLVREVVRSVDSRFATRRGRRFRAIGGNSEGGYAAVNLTLRNPRLFSIGESWSGYLWQNHKGAFAGATEASVRANDPQRYAPLLRAQLRRYPVHFFIYKGTREPSVVKVRARKVAGELSRAGAHVTFAIYKGGHDWKIWRDQTPRMLAYANRWFGARR
jgi:enterochelin esterase-like enzyme